MQTYPLKTAPDELERLFDAAQRGKTVVLVDEQGRAVKLVPIESLRPKKPRKAGSARGKVKIADDFDAPLDEFAPYVE